MLLVKGDNITFKYDLQTQELFQKISFRVDNNAQIGIVGKNGSGKSTLLKILLGELKPISGYLQISSKLMIGHLRQIQISNESVSVDDFVWSANPDLHAIKKRLTTHLENSCDQDWSLFSDYEEAGGYDFEVFIEKNLAKVELEAKILQRPFQTLSGGEKTKVGLLRILVTHPSLLLLDEPTNNLDIKSIQWLKEFLNSITLPFIVVSHNRELLNNSVREIWEIEKSELKIYSGNYDFLKQMKEYKYKTDLEQFEQQQKKIKQLELAASDKRADAQRMENFKESRSIKKNGGLCKRDNGSGSGLANPTKKMRAAKAVEKRIQHMIEKEEARRPLIEKKRKIFLPMGKPCTSKFVLNVKELRLNYGSKTVFSNLSFAVEMGQRLAIVGFNGCGKTSLIKILNNQLNQSHGEFYWAASTVKSVFFQENTHLRADMTVLESIWQKEIIEQSVARTVLGSLGLGVSFIDRKIESLSSGEKVKVSLAKVVLSGANTLILDEPTNHLEIQGREMLEYALLGFEGTVIFVSHDLAFIKKIGTHVFDLSSCQMFKSYEVWEDSIL